MSTLVIVFGLFMAVLGTTGIVSPELLMRLARYWDNQAGIYAAAVIRIIMALALLWAAPDSRYPEGLRILGLIVLIAGIATPFFGQERTHRIMEWWAARSIGFKRAWAGFALLFGIFLIYAVA